MALPFDTGLAPQTAAELQPLAEAILQADPTDESDWLEWKQRLDLSDKQYQFELAKHILGFANRPVQSASLHCRGFAYLFIGIEPQSVTGVETLDPAQLVDAINTYVGSDGPIWKHHYLRLDNHDVLAIVVHPPKSGDLIHLLRKGYNNSDNATAFVRKSGKTDRADLGDFANLQERLRGTRLDLDITISAAQSISWFDDAVIGESIHGIAQMQGDSMISRAQSTLLRAGRSSPTSTVPVAFQDSFLSPDKRTFEEYQAQVVDWQNRWATQAQTVWLQRYLETGHGLCSLTLKNLTDRNFGSVEVQLEIKGALVLTDLDEVEAKLPNAPRELGKPKPILIPSSSFDHERLSAAILANTSAPSIYAEYDEGVAYVVWDAGDIRPRATVRSDDIYIVINSKSHRDELSAQWTATTTSADGVNEAQLPISVSESPVAFDDIEHELGLDNL